MSIYQLNRSVLWICGADWKRPGNLLLVFSINTPSFCFSLHYISTQILSRKNKMSNNMNAKLLLFLVLLCFPSFFMVRKPFCAAAGFKIIGTALGKIGNFAQGVTSLCELFDYINFFNCSSLSSAATTKTDDTMPDVSFGQQLIPLVVGEGNAQQNVSLILDISLDLSFMLCQRCGDYCSTNLPVYNPSQSDTFPTLHVRAQHVPVQRPI